MSIFLLLPFSASLESSSAFLTLYSLLLIENGLAPSKYLAHQGTNLGRKGRIYVEKQDDSGVIWVGGDVVTCIEGEVLI